MCLMTKAIYKSVYAIIISINFIMYHTLIGRFNKYFSEINCFRHFNMMEVCLVKMD